MNQHVLSGNGTGDAHAFPAVLAWIALALAVFVAVSAFSSRSAVTVAPPAHADPAASSGPADWQAAQQYGRIDHSVLLGAPDMPDANPAGASIAAYETSRQ